MAFRQQIARPAHHYYHEHEVEAEIEVEVEVEVGARAENEALRASAPSQDTPRTIAFSRLSDWGSFNAIESSVPDDGDVDEDGELDSLDDGLRAFQDPTAIDVRRRRLDHSEGSILPTHDGLGGFDHRSSLLQEQIWRFERHNPLRRGPHLGAALEEEEQSSLESSKRKRIEQWRLDQSLRAEEEAEPAQLAAASSIDGETRCPEDQDSLQRADGTMTVDFPSAVGSSQAAVSAAEAEQEMSFWHDLARQFIEKVLGIDDTILAMILGESLLVDEKTYQPSPQPKPFGIALAGRSAIWDDGLLVRLARSLARQLSGQPYAVDQMLHPRFMDYGGIPVPRRLTECQDPSMIQPPEHSKSVEFMPTLRDHGAGKGQEDDTEKWDGDDSEIVTPLETTRSNEVDYWEQTPSWRTIFGYLQRRFLSQRRSGSISATPNIATTHSPSSLHRAAVIKQCHPLVSRVAKQRETLERRPPLHLRCPSNSILSVSLKRAGSTCASLSTKRSRRQASAHSKNYWDLGESVGSGSAMGFAGLGAWGEI